MTSPAAESRNSAVSQTWPASRFYWAEIDAMGWRGAGVLPQGLLASLGEEFPVPIDALHLVAFPARNGRVIVCGCTIERLRELEPACAELRPDSGPASLPDTLDLNGFNLLIGAFESPMMRRRRQAQHLFYAATSILLSIIVAIGLVRRGWHDEAVSAASAKASGTLLGEFAFDRRDETLARQAKAMQGVAEVVRKTKVPADAAMTLQSLLKVWPASIPAKPLSVSVAADGVSIGVTVEGDPSPFLKAFQAPDGFALDEPRITAAGTTTRLALHIRPIPGIAKP